MRTLLTQDKVTTDALLDHLGGREWVEICTNAIDILYQTPEERPQYRGFKVVYPLKYNSETQNTLAIVECRISYRGTVRAHYTSPEGVNCYRVELRTLTSVDDREIGHQYRNFKQDFQYKDCYTVEEFITNFQEITNTTLFM
jgi:hypothetical protein